MSPSVSKFAWFGAVFLGLAACAAAPAAAAGCAVITEIQSRDQVLAMINTCREQLRQASEDLDNADPDVKKKAAQRMIDTQKVVDDWGKAAQQMEAAALAPDAKPETRRYVDMVMDIKAFAANEAEYPDDLAKAKAIVGAPAAPPVKTPDSPPGGAVVPPRQVPGDQNAPGSTAGGTQPPPAKNDSPAGTGAPPGAGAPTGGKTRAGTPDYGRGGGAGSSGGGGSSDGAGGSATMSGDVGSATAGSVGNAGAVGKLGGALKSSLDSSGRLAAADFNGGPAASKMGAFGAGGKIPPPAPMSDASLASAAGPHAAAFAKNGLTVALGADGRPAIVDRQGRPASDAQRASLIADIRAEPSAVERDPNYLNPQRGGIAASDYDALKDTYRGDAAARTKDFKHIVLTPPGEERDFTRSESCEIVSGDCNPHAKKSYAKGETVPASDLKSIMASLRDRVTSARDRRERAAASRSRFAGAGKGVGGLLGRLSSWLSGGDRDAAGSGELASAGSSREGSVDSVRGAQADGAGASGGSASKSGASASPVLASAGGVSPARVAFGLLGLLGTGLVAGAVYVLFKREKKSWNA